jgi:hypothetical protein
MDMEVVKKCVEIAAQQRRGALGAVDDDIQALLDELNAQSAVASQPASVIEEPPAKPARKAK